MTGDPPLLLGANIIESLYNDVDDLPSSARYFGYKTLYVSCCEFDFDAKHNWIFRGYNNKNTPTQLQDKPKWFDKVIY